MKNRNPNESTTKNDRDVSRVLVRVIKDLMAEIHSGSAASRPVTLDSSLDKDLGLDSLMRVELLARIERHFGVTLPERIFADAETPRDLWRAVLAADSQQLPEAAREAVSLDLEAVEAVPHHALTLVEALSWHAETNPERPHIRFYDDQDQGETITYRELWEGATAVAAGLQRGGLQTGEPVAVMLPTGSEYFFTFFGVLLAGGIPAPLYPPNRLSQLEEHLQRQTAILSNSAARLLVAMPEAKPFAKLLKSRVPTLENLVTSAELAAEHELYRQPKFGEQDLALLQYTSGSTGNPKGVALTHANLLASVRAMGQVLEVGDSEVCVSWLPLYHDMGLIGAWLGSLYHGVLLVIMPPLSFMARPQRWLRAIHRYGAHHSVAPNFAYELCLRRLEDKDLEGLDLSTWRVAMNGAEPINPDTIQRFCDRFAPYGFKREALMPVFGLAECSLGLAFPPLNRGPVVDAIHRESFMRFGRAEPADQGDSGTLRFVACGQPLPGHEIRIVDSGGRELPDRREGNLQFRGPAATKGYFRNPEQTRLLFHDDWLDSGDMAYIASGDLFITGRRKDVIIRAGRNMYPQELEEAVGVLPGIVASNVVAFGSTDPKTGTERLVVMAETRRRNPEDLTKLETTINGVATELIGSPPEEVLLVPPKTVLRTSSGKIRRAACRELFERNRIGRKKKAGRWGKILFSLSDAIGRWRRIRRNLSETLYSSYLWTWFALLAPFVWLAVFLLPRPAWRWSFIHGLGRVLIHVMRIPLTVRGTENLSQDSPYVLVSNHASYIDVFILVAVLARPVRFVSKAEFLDVPVIRIFLSRLQTEFVERIDKEKGLEDARRISQSAQAGGPLLYFPEGTFTRTPGVLPFHMGAFATAAELGLPVVPMAIRGTRSMLRDESWFLRRKAITVTIGRAIESGKSEEGKENRPWERTLKLRNESRQHILRYCGEPDLSHEKSPI
ncbi:MAG: AMP-binding protein [Proteobacteria bacterium]|nr:AMP-binding protein [Pseudomonadota bacterium]